MNLSVIPVPLQARAPLQQRSVFPPSPLPAEQFCTAELCCHFFSTRAKPRSSGEMAYFRGRAQEPGASPCNTVRVNRNTKGRTLRHSEAAAFRGEAWREQGAIPPRLWAPHHDCQRGHRVPSGPGQNLVTAGPCPREQEEQSTPGDLPSGTACPQTRHSLKKLDIF